MGFGILFFGYFIANLMSLNSYGALFTFLGYLLMGRAFLQLAEYEKKFLYALYASLPLGLIALYRIVGLCSELFLWNLPIFGEVAGRVTTLLEFVAFLVFHVFLVYAIRRQATAVELPALSKAAVRNLIVVSVYALAVTVGHLPFGFVDDWYNRYFSFPIVLLQLISYLLMLVLIARCYMWICPEGDEEMPLKKSRFALVNKIREETAKREQQAADSTKEYAEEKLRKRKEAREEQLRQKKSNRSKRKK